MKRVLNATAGAAAQTGASTRVVTIDLSQIGRNWRAIAARVRPAECAAVVKADAYGLGLARVVPALEAAGCRTFFVATLEEAAALRALSAAATIYVLDGLLPGQRGPLVEIDARPVLSSLPEVHDWAELGSGRRGPQAAALQLETGMNRLGLSLSEIDALAAAPDLLAQIDARLVMSHLASADNLASPQNAAQLAAFCDCKARLPASVSADESLGASRGVLLGADYYFDLVRPGYALFAGLPDARDVRQAVTIEARVLAVRDVERGEAVGYGAAWTARRRSRIAVVAYGYADGMLRLTGGTDDRAADLPSGEVAFRGRRAPIVGRISMDLITVDVTDLRAGSSEDLAPRRGDLVEIIGSTIGLNEAAAAAGTIGYELLTGLSRRAARVYSEEPHGQS